ARDGTTWVATDDGLTRLDATASFKGVTSGSGAAPMFKTFKPPGGSGATTLRTLLEAHDGTILVGTFGGLFRFHPTTETFEKVGLGYSGTVEGTEQINDLLEDDVGNLWIATRYLGLICLHPDGALDPYLLPVVPPAGNVRAIAFDGQGGMWAGGWDG